MQYTSVGDLAHSYSMRSHSTRIKQEFIRLSETLASGQHTDMSKQLRGEFSGLASVERSIEKLSSFRTTASETKTLLETAQIALETFQDLGTEMGPSLITAGNSAHPAILRTTSNDAAQKMDSAVSALNVRIADRSVFSGRATDMPALISASEMLEEIHTLVAGLSDVQDVLNTVETWFTASGGGYETFAFKGSSTTLAPIPVSEDEQVQFDVTAEAEAVRSSLQAFALAAISVDLPLISGNAEQASLMKEAGELMLTSQSDVAILRADIGAMEAYTEGAHVRNEAALSTFKIMQTELYSADPYETATQLEIAQTQLEAVYTLTARISRLSLADYLR